MSDDDIIERGGTQEDIGAYAHDVGGACGAMYGGTCDYCGETDSDTPSESEFDKELGGILSAYASCTHVPKVFKTSAEMDKSEAIAAIKQAVDKHVIGDDKHGTICGSSLNGICNCQYSDENGKLAEQRKALYGGDKK